MFVIVNGLHVRTDRFVFIVAGLRYLWYQAFLSLYQLFCGKSSASVCKVSLTKPSGKSCCSWLLRKEAWWKIMTVVSPSMSTTSRWSRRLLVSSTLRPPIMSRLRALKSLAS